MGGEDLEGFGKTRNHDQNILYEKRSFPIKNMNSKTLTSACNWANHLA